MSTHVQLEIFEGPLHLLLHLIKKNEVSITDIPMAVITEQYVATVGLMQTWAAVEHGTWYARSAEFLQTPTINTLRWMRVVGDTIFAVGVLAMGWFKVGLLTGHSFVREAPEVQAGELTPDRERVGVP